MPGRKFTAGTGYRYGFNGKEKSDEVYGDGNIYDYGFRIYNPRLGKFLSVDPLCKSYPWNSSYAFSENDVLRCIDLDGLEKYYVINYWKNGVKEKTEIEAYTDIKSNQIINMQFKLAGAPLTEKDVVIYDVYDEYTKKERISQSDATELTIEQAKIFTKAFTIEKLKGGKGSITNDLDKDVPESSVSSEQGLLHRKASKNYIDKNKAGGKSINLKIQHTDVEAGKPVTLDLGFIAKLAYPFEESKAITLATEIASQIKNTNIQVEITGYVILGKSEDNNDVNDIVPNTSVTYRDLALSRADYIRKKLIDQGVNSNQIKISSPTSNKAHTEQKITATFTPKEK